MNFGEFALVAHAEVECRVLDRAAFDQLGASHPQIKIALLKNMLRSAHEIVDRLSREVAALAG
ncbi:MAG: hypothetical protein ABI809_05255 [Caldimonas sp.]